VSAITPRLVLGESLVDGPPFTVIIIVLVDRIERREVGGLPALMG
jgi:hypothetical protein